jgi:hypothetical protein
MKEGSFFENVATFERINYRKFRLKLLYINPRKSPSFKRGVPPPILYDSIYAHTRHLRIRLATEA